MKKMFLSIATILCSTVIVAQSVGINNPTPDASAILDVKSNTKGMLIPRTSSVSRVAILNPAKGLILYDTTTAGFWFNNGTAWSQISAGGNGWGLAGNTGTNPINNFIGTTDEQPLRFRINNTWAGEMHPTSGNIYIGLNSGEATTLGGNNTAVGEHSLKLNTEGSFNTAFGTEALTSTTIGGNNTAIGGYSMYHNTEGYENTATGKNSLFLNTTGRYNTATGMNALLSNTTGQENTAIGHYALQVNTADYNTATGASALLVNTTGSSNTADGCEALYSNSSGSANTANGYEALYSNTTGTGNIAGGYGALYSNSIGNYNIGVGMLSLNSNTSASQNVAIGYLALSSQDYYNSGVPWVSANTAVGFAALSSNRSTTNSDGIYNTAVGHSAMISNTYGGYNTAEGYAALYSNISGTGNTGTGYRALNSNTDGDYNTAYGVSALYSNTGSNNTAVGVAALYSNTGGSNNIAIGQNSGTDPGSPNVTNTISIGNDGILNGSNNQAFIGNLNMQWIGGRVTWFTYSDARIKNNISEDVKGIDFISRLRPVTYYISNKAITTLTGNKETPDYPGKNDNEKVKCSGFIAQEVEQAAKAAGYDFSGYTTPKNEHALYTLSYEQFVVPLVKAVQEQQAIIKTQQQQIDQLLKRIEAIEKTIR